MLNRTHFAVVLALAALGAFFLPNVAEAKKLNVVTATTDMAALAQG